jgi:integrase
MSKSTENDELIIRGGHWKLAAYPKNLDISKNWLVQLDYTDPCTGEKLRKQIRNGINYLKSRKERIREVKDLMSALKKKLLAGWNPIGTLPPVSAEMDPSKMTFNEALDFALKSKKPNLVDKSETDIGGVKNFAKAAAVKLGIDKMPVIQTRKLHIKQILVQIGHDRQQAYNREKRKVKRKWTGNSYNKYKGFLSLLFKELGEYEAVEFNPCSNISNQKEITTNIHKHSTEKETQAIKEHLHKNYPDFNNYLAFEYLTGMRPLELFRIRIESIDYFNQRFVLEYYEGKTQQTRFIPIPNSLMRYLEDMNLDTYPPTYYIFSDNFKPGPNCRGTNRSDYASRFWKMVIKDGLGINVSLYSFKGKGGEAKREAGIATGSVSAGFGHGSINMSYNYLHGEQDRINREIIEKTPDF